MSRADHRNVPLNLETHSSVVTELIFFIEFIYRWENAIFNCIVAANFLIHKSCTHRKQVTLLLNVNAVYYIYLYIVYNTYISVLSIAKNSAI